MCDREDNMAVLGSEQRFDLRAVPFSKRGAFLCVLEDEKDRNLYLSVTRSPDLWMQRKNLVRIVPVMDNKELIYEYEVQPDKLTIHTVCGTAEICFDEKNHLHIRGQGIHLRFSSSMMLFENCVSTEDGALEAAYIMIGKLLFVPLLGAMYSDAIWVPQKSRADDFIIEFLPAVETNRFEAVIQEYYSNGLREKFYLPFDDCARACAEEFTHFYKRFPQVSKKYEKEAVLAAFTIWTHTMGPVGILENEVVYLTRTKWLRAFSWEQGFQAMASKNDKNEAVKLLMNMFCYQNESGQLPDSVGENGISYMVAKPPIQGFAMNYLLRDFALTDLSKEECTRLYSGFCHLADWWLTNRDRNHSQIPQYYHSNESGFPDATIFRKGFPLQSPDLLSMLILLTEVCGKLALYAGASQGETESWTKESQHLLNILLADFWDGKQFVARLAADGGIVESESAISYLPIILGKRLPQEIIETIAEQLMKEEEYLCEGGVLSENEKSPYFDGAGSYFSRGSILGAMQVFFVIGLEDAGLPDEAREIAERWCRLCAKNGMLLQQQSLATISHDNAWDSWTSACFLVLASGIK